MKNHLILAAAIFLLASFSTALADTPAKIAEDYRKAAAAALTKLNGTLEAATVPLIAALVKAGDTTGAEELQEQLKAKTAGEPVLKPQASAVLLFAQYDQARGKALEPAQKAAVGRIEVMLAGKESSKLDVVKELGKVRAEVEAAKAGQEAAALPVAWSFRRSPTAGTDGIFMLNPDGTTEMRGGGGNSGQWKHSAKAHTITVEWVKPKDTWTVLFLEGNELAEIHSMVWKETRYLKAMTDPSAK